MEESLCQREGEGKCWIPGERTVSTRRGPVMLIVKQSLILGKFGSEVMVAKNIVASLQERSEKSQQATIPLGAARNRNRPGVSVI